MNSYQGGGGSGSKSCFSSCKTVVAEVKNINIIADQCYSGFLTTCMPGRTTVSVPHSHSISCATFLSIPQFAITYDPLLNRHMTTRNLFVN